MDNYSRFLSSAICSELFFGKINLTVLSKRGRTGETVYVKRKKKTSLLNYLVSEYSGKSSNRDNGIGVWNIRY